MAHQLAVILLFGLGMLAGLVLFLVVAYWLFFRAPHTTLPAGRYAGR
jgi:tellurite resistance protein TehA-like permease